MVGQFNPNFNFNPNENAAPLAPPVRINEDALRQSLLNSPKLDITPPVNVAPKLDVKPPTAPRAADVMVPEAREKVPTEPRRVGRIEKALTVTPANEAIEREPAPKPETAPDHIQEDQARVGPVPVDQTMAAAAPEPAPAPKRVGRVEKSTAAATSGEAVERELPATLTAKAEKVAPTPAPTPTPTPAAVAEEAKPEPAAPKPVVQEVKHPLYARPVGFDSMDHVDPGPDAVSDKSTDRIWAALSEQKDASLGQAGTRRLGSASQDVISASPKVRLEELSASAEMLVEMWQEPTSYLRTLITRYLPNVDQGEMLDDYALALDTMWDLFNNNDILGLCEKTVNDEATTHTRVIRVHMGPGTRIHPSIAKMFNADFDGDKLKLSFDPDVMGGAKNAIAYLISTDGDLKIDPDYFSIHPWAGDVSLQLESMFSEFNLTRLQLNGLVSAIEQSWKSDDPEPGLKSMMRWARSIGMNPGLNQSEGYVVGEILQRIYATNTEILRAKLIIDGVMDEFGVIPQLEDGMEADEDADYPRSGLGSNRAEPFANKKDVEQALNTPFGWVPGKNMPFRITSGWGKMARLSHQVFGRRGTVDRKTFLDMLALQMSGIQDFDESARSVSEIARRAIQARVGYPNTSSDRAFVSWLHDFVKAYNEAAFIINSAAVTVKLDKSLAPSERFFMPAIPTESGTAKNSETRKQVKSVFGGIRMDVLFQGKCPAGYANYTLDEFIYKNRMGIESLGSPGDKFENAEVFIGRLADMRTSFAKKIHDELIGTPKEPGALARQMVTLPDGRTTTMIGRLVEVLSSVDGQKHLARETELLVSAFHFLGQEMFTYLGLDNLAGFESTALGRKFLAADTEDKLLGVLYEAIASYRFSDLKKLRTLYDAAVEAGDTEAIVNYASRYEAELDEIASSSDTWASVVRAYKNGRLHVSEDQHNGKDVLDYIFFSGWGGQSITEKLNGLVTSDPLGRPDQQEFEIAAELYANPKGMHAKNRFMSDFGHGQLLSDIKSSSDKMDAYGEVNWTHCVKSVEEAFAQHDGQLKKFLDIARKDPRALVEFRAWMMTDAILTVLDPSYASTEKGQQETAGKYLYSAVCYMLNAGVWSHMAFGGDFSVGKISLERFWKSPGLLVRLLSDPKFSLTVYDANGEFTLSMKEIFKTNTPSESQLWDWLKANPRAAMALRMTSQSNGVDKKGSANTTATKSLSKTIEDVLEVAKQKPRVDEIAMMTLADNPGFYALVSLTVGMTGMRRFQLRNTTTESIASTIRFLRGFYKNGLPTKAAVDSAVDALFLTTFGAERMAAVDKTYELGKSQEANAIGSADADDVRDDDDYQLGQIREAMKVGILKYATKLAQPGSGVPPLARLSAAQTAKLFKLADKSTIRAYHDVEQTVGGVKTDLDTSVNGAESRLLAPLMFLAYATPEPCDAKQFKAEIGWMDFGSRFAEFIGLQANLGNNEWMPINETNWLEIAKTAKSRDGIVRVEDPAVCTSPTCACKRHATADQSTNYGNPHTPAFVRLLTIVRTLSAEKLNLKVKTKGVDGYDSVAKNFLFENPLYTTAGPRIKVKVNSTYARVFESTGDKTLAMAAARSVLATHLQKVYSSMRYESEISINDYVNIAHIMLREMPEVDGVPQLEVLAMGQINVLVGQALRNTRAADPRATSDDYGKAAEGALLSAGAMLGGLDQDTIFSGFKVQREFFVQPQLVSQRESSMSRNMELVARIVAETGVKPVSDTELDQFEQGYHTPYTGGNAIASMLTDNIFTGDTPGDWVPGLADQFPGYFKQWQRVAGKVPADFHSSDSGRRYTYRVIGVFGIGKSYNHQTKTMQQTEDSEYKLSVGPRNAFIVDARSSDAVRAIVLAYRHGINVLLDGDLSIESWRAIYRKTGLDMNQGVQVKNGGRVLGTLIPMFDLRLNGRNTVLNEGATNAGAFYAVPDGNLRYYFESLINEHGAGDADFVRTKATDSIRHNKEGDYRLKASIAFANLLSWVDSRDDETAPGERIIQGRGVPSDPDRQPVKLVIFGSRDYDNYDVVKRAIENTEMYKRGLISEVISGEASGPDKLGARWARENGVPVREMPAAWDDLEARQGNRPPRIKKNKHGKLYNADAGSIRNAAMYEYGDAGIGFWDGKSAGTKNMKYRFSDAKFAKKLLVVRTDTGAVEVNGVHVRNIANTQRVVRERGIPTCEVAPAFDIEMDIIDPYREGRLEDAPIDLGIPVVNDVEHARLEEGIRTFMARMERGELGENGLLPTARPGEIIGFMRAEIGDEVRYHPIRPFEMGNSSGAPATMVIQGAGFDHTTGEIVVNWAHEGTMAGRFFKIFEDGNASAKFMARAQAVHDMALEDGTELIGYIARASTSTRRLLMRRQQKMLTLIYKARTAPWGYNLAETPGMLPGKQNEALRAALLTGKSSVGLWKARLKEGPIHFIADPDLNGLLNYMADRCVRYGIDPTIMFASYRVEGDKQIPNYMWFNYQLILKGNRTYQDSLMRLMHAMNPALCPDGLEDTSGDKTLFDRNLQVLRPVYDEDGTLLGHERVDMYGGWHFLDGHYYGNSGSGARVSTYAIPSLPALMAGGKKLPALLLKQYLDWANIGRENDAAMPMRARSTDQPDS